MELTTLPRPQVGWGGDTLFPFLSPRYLRCLISASPPELVPQILEQSYAPDIIACMSRRCQSTCHIISVSFRAIHNTPLFASWFVRNGVMAQSKRKRQIWNYFLLDMVQKAQQSLHC